MHATKRHGLTLIEVIFVLGIVAFAAAMFVPATRGGRHAARRSECKNNLKQIGLAMHNYHDTFNRLPPGYVVGDEYATHLWGWSTYLLPYIDQNPLYNQLNVGVAGWIENDKSGSNTVLPAFRCSSDVGSPLVIGSIKAARSNYVANNGCHLAINFAVNNPVCSTASLGTTGCVGGGPFSRNSNFRFPDCQDGLSNTFLVGERSSATTISSSMVGGDSIWIGAANVSPNGVGLILGDTHAVPNSSVATPYGYSSKHTGGAQFLMADGAVRFISSNIDLHTFQQISQHADLLPVGDF